MIHFFRKIRWRLAQKNQFFKYSRYAVGEIVLVVIGILIALQINNWNELRKLKLTENSVLEGIRKDILLDTIDLNFNIRAYRIFIEGDSILIQNLLNKTGYSKRWVRYIDLTINGDWVILLNETRFQEAKQKGLSLISNDSLREQIIKLYEVEYKVLSMTENERNIYNYNEYLINRLGKYFSVDSTGLIMTMESFQKLAEDENSLYLLHKARADRKYLLELHLSTLESAISVADKIENEIGN